MKKIILSVFLLSMSALTFAQPIIITQWVRAPIPKVTNKMFAEGVDRYEVNTSFSSDLKGKIINVDVLKSSGNPVIDEAVIKAFSTAKIRLDEVDGKFYPAQCEQAFILLKKRQF